MSVVFIVLTILAVAIKIFEKVESMLPEGTTAAAPPTPQRREPAPPVVQKPTTDSGDAEIAAAIAVSLTLAEQSATAPARLTTAREQTSTASGWITTGRARAMSGRIIGSPTRGRANR